jgi:hypothetical protein
MRRFTGRLSMRTLYISAPGRSVFPGLGSIVTIAVALGVAAWAGQARANEHWFPSNCLPQSNSQYTATLHQLYAAGLIDLSDPIHFDFTSCDPPPLPGNTTNHSFNSLVRARISTDSGQSYQNHQVPAQVTVRVTNLTTIGDLTIFDTEMLQLDISGGTLPAGTMIRESPTQASTGRTTERPGAGGYYIDSFFDVFTELSLDGGQTWMPSDNGAGHVEMDIINPTPTKNRTWGLIKSLYRR